MDSHYAYFCFKGTSDVSEITKVLNLQPTKSWNVGDKRKNGSIYDFSFWSYESKTFEKETIDKSIEEVLNFIESKKIDSNSIKGDFQFLISCVGHHENYMCGFFLSKEVIEKLHFHGLAVDFDLYCHKNSENDFHE